MVAQLFQNPMLLFWTTINNQLAFAVNRQLFQNPMPAVKDYHLQTPCIQDHHSLL